MMARRKSALHVVAGLLIASAVVRTLGEAGPALANDSSDTPAVIETATQEVSTPVLAALQARAAQLDAREEKLDADMAALTEAKLEIDEKLVDLIAAEEALSATIAQVDTASTDDLRRLTIMYENMKPKEAAELFETMNPEFAAGFLGLMQPDAAARIMSQLDPETGYSFSVVLAGRNANAPTD